MKKNIILLLIFLGALSCTKKENKKGDGTTIPRLTFMSISDTVISFNDTTDWWLNMGFYDGDGDIGRNMDDTLMAVYITDSRNLENVYKYPFPFIPDGDRTVKYLEGSMKVRLKKNAFFLPRNDSAHLENDTLELSVYIVDEAGQHSDTIKSGILYIQP